MVGREYVEKLAPALAALMRRRRDPDELELQLRMLRRVVTSGLDEAMQYLLINVIETYFPVPDSERERYGRLRSREEYKVVQDVELTWGDRLLLKGVEQGKRETLKRQLASKFGPLPADVDARIDAVTSAEELDGYLDRVLKASTLEQIGLEG